MSSEESFFDFFKTFRAFHPLWGGKSQFKKHYKKLSVHKTEEWEVYVLKCITAKTLSDNGTPILCDVKFKTETVPIHEIKANKNYLFDEEAPREVKEAIGLIKTYVKNKYCTKPDSPRLSVLNAGASPSPPLQVSIPSPYAQISGNSSDKTLYPSL